MEGTPAGRWTAKARSRRNRLWMIVSLVVLVGIAASLYAAMRQIAAQRAREHKQSFYQYVVTHHIGSLQEIDDGTGFDPVSYLLTINHPLPADQAFAFATNLMKRYVLFDHGQLLSIVYKDPQSGRQRPLADVHYDDDAHVLSVTVTDASGNARHYVRHVDW
ncbi:MAG: hypothetical protein IRZ33_02025 [Alicyclobacillaceae bacterium]|nr:hypothetical protein [Alicyclobacillaceae bacterium]